MILIYLPGIAPVGIADSKVAAKENQGRSSKGDKPAFKQIPSRPQKPTQVSPAISGNKNTSKDPTRVSFILRSIIV